MLKGSNEIDFTAGRLCIFLFSCKPEGRMVFIVAVLQQIELDVEEKMEYNENPKITKLPKRDRGYLT